MKSLGVNVRRAWGWLGRGAGGPPCHERVRWLLLRGLGLSYAFAFGSLSLQIPGLLGPQGVLPAESWLSFLREQLGTWSALTGYPSLFWVTGAGDFALQAACAVGTLAGLALAGGVLERPLAVVAWALFVSLASVGREFLHFQWDSLLLETGFLGIFLAGRGPTSGFVIWLLRWLCFRLVFGSGVVKLASGDDAWAGLTALRFHFETQPLPTALAWYAHQLSDGFLRLATAGMFAVELVISWLVFLPRRARSIAAAAMIALQLGVAATGNYGYFNLLSIVLALACLDDASIEFVFRRLNLACCLRYLGPAATPLRPKRSFAREAARGAIFAILGVLAIGVGGGRLYGQLAGRRQVPDIVADVAEYTDRVRLVNPYGLFAIMTRERLELRVEGTRDGREWKPYRFRWKPDSVHDIPGWVAPHQPRLDWQMWFAALASYQPRGWFGAFLHRLLEGSAPVLALLEDHPFPEGPPVKIRVYGQLFHLTSVEERQASGGAWWRADPEREFAPEMSLYPETRGR